MGFFADNFLEITLKASKVTNEEIYQKCKREERQKGNIEPEINARENTQPALAVPSVPQTDLPPIAWTWEASIFSPAVESVATQDFDVHETGPPRPAGPLYLRHCALLN